MDIFHNFFYVPIFNLLMVLYQLFSENLGLAIIGVALIAKLITLPLSRKQIKSAKQTQVFQKRSQELKKKYKDDQDQLAKEMAKIQAEFLPAQLGGCLNLIIVIVLLIQVRNVVLNLVNQGVHAFNQVAYSEALKFPEDSVTLSLPDGFEFGIHELDYKVVAMNGNELNKNIVFGVAQDEEQKEELKKEILERNNDLSEEEKEKLDKQMADERSANIGLFISSFDAEEVLIGAEHDLEAFLRPPSRETINYEELEVKLDGEVLASDELTITEWAILNFEFIGADMSRVATDIGFSNLNAVMPYLLIAVSVGVTQFFASRIQSGFSAVPKAEEPKKKKSSKTKASKDKKDDDEPNFAEMMQSSTKSMLFIFPVITILMSLGFLGGANFFPTGVSVFWTGQSAFVIIEQLISNRDKLIKKLSSQKSKDEG